MALTLAQEAVGGGHHHFLPMPQRMFVLMPFMHAESARMQAESVRLFTALGDPDLMKFASGHADCIAPLRPLPQAQRSARAGSRRPRRWPISRAPRGCSSGTSRRALHSASDKPETRQMELEDKIALVTGAGSGLGEASALALARAGADVVLVSRTRDQLEAVAKKIEAMGRQAIVYPTDTADAKGMKDLFGSIGDRFGRLDFVFANAGINGVWAPIEDLQPDEWDETIRVNLRGTYLTVHHAVPLMKQSGGSIAITASINGTRTFTTAGASAYSTTKAGQLALGQMLALELPSTAFASTSSARAPSSPRFPTTPKSATPRRPESRRTIPKAPYRSPAASRARAKTLRTWWCSWHRTVRATSAARRSGSTERSRCWSRPAACAAPARPCGR